MFKVGKKYKQNATNAIRECVWANSTHAALFCEEWPGLANIVAHEAIKDNPEHVEPLKGYVNVYKDPLGFGMCVHNTRDGAENHHTGGKNHPNYLKTIEVTYVPES